MAIRMRRGNYADLDETKLVEGEFAVCLDNGYVFVKCGTAGVVQLGTADTIEEALEQAQAYVSDAQGYAGDAEDSASAASTSATTSSNKSLDAEAWAKGTRNGIDVPSTDPTYHNNAKYYAEEAAVGDVPIATTLSLGVVKPDGTTITVENNGTIHSATSGIPTGGSTGQVLTKHSNTDRDVEWSTPATTVASLTDTSISNPTNGQGLIYDSANQQWKNGNVSGGSSDWSDITNKPFNTVDSNVFVVSNGQITETVPTYYIEVSGDDLAGNYQTENEPIVLPDGALSTFFSLVLTNTSTTKAWKTSAPSQNTDPTVWTWIPSYLYVREYSSNNVKTLTIYNRHLSSAPHYSEYYQINLARKSDSVHYGGKIRLEFSPSTIDSSGGGSVIASGNIKFIEQAADYTCVKSNNEYTYTLIPYHSAYILFVDVTSGQYDYYSHSAYFITVPESSASDRVPKGIKMAASTNTGLTITYGFDTTKSAPWVKIAPSNSSYQVHPYLFRVYGS